MLFALLSLALQVENLDRFGGSPEARKVLLERGFVVTDERRRQICSFYIHSDAVFVTTDALLYAYYANLEKGVLDLERRQARLLPPLLDKLAAAVVAFRAKGLDPRWAEAAGRVELYVAVARALAAGATSEVDLAKLPEAVAQEVRLILKAEKPAVSPLRGLTLDYPRFAPRGFYAGPLERFARASTWLREVPFRVTDERESQEATVLARALQEDWETLSSLEDLNEPYLHLLGPAEDPDLRKIDSVVRNGMPDMRVGARDDGAKARALLLEAIPTPRLSSIPSAGAQLDPASTRGLRLLPRPVSVDAFVMGALSPPGKPLAPPSGTALMAVLGSRVAREIAADRLKDGLFEAASAAMKEGRKNHDGDIARSGRRLYRSLLEPEIPPNAPPWYRHEGWRAKDLNTALAGWAHERMIWDLHGYRNVSYGGLTRPPPGLIEPNPAFFDALLDLTLRMDDFLRAYDITSPRFPRLAVLLREVHRTLGRQLEGKAMLPEDRTLFAEFGPRLGNICGFDGNSWLSDVGLPDTSFQVSVAFEISQGVERIVGQGQPRALYVVAEHEGRRYVASGGVLSYRELLAPASGPERMTAERWRRHPPPAPDWASRFAVDFKVDDLHRLLEEGQVVEQMFERPDGKMGEILARKIAARDRFQQRRQAVRLFGATGHPRLVEILLPFLHKPPRGPDADRDWPYEESMALRGRLKPEHLDVFLGWIGEGHPMPSDLLALAATIPDDATRDRVLDAMDKPSFTDVDEIQAVMEELARPPGLRMSRKILERMARYPEPARRGAGRALAERWASVDERGKVDFSAEEGEFREKLLVMLRSLGLKME